MFMAKRRSQAQSVYGYETPVVSVFPSPVAAFRSPTTSDTGYLVGQLWINQTSNQCWIMTSVSGGLATWALSSPGASDVDTLTADVGGPISPLAGNITLATGANLTSTGAGAAVTFTLDPAITLATSVTSPLYTSGAGVDVQVTAPAGQDVVIQLGDAAGANKLSITDSTAAEVFAIDSNGTFAALAGLTVTGALTQTAGVVNIGQDNAADAINIGGGTTARAIGIGNSAASHTLTLGSTNTTASTILQSGTGDTLITSTDRITADSVGVLELNSSGAAISIGNDANAFAINVGTGGAARVITVGNITGATQVDVNTGTGGSTWTTTNGAFALNTGTGSIGIGTDAAAKTLTLGNSTGATSVVLNCGTGALNIGTNAIAHTVTLGNSTGATSLVLDCGTGALNVGTNAIAHTVTLGNITGATAVNVNSGTGACAWTTTNGTFGLVTGTGAINLGADAAAKTLTLGNITGATAVNVNTGTGGSTYTTTNGTFSLVTGTGAINLGADAAAKTVTIGNATGASSVVVNGGTGAMSFAATATDHTTTVGSTTGASPTVLQAGTGKFTMTGTVRELTGDYVTRTGDSITFYSNPSVSTVLNTGGAPTGVASDTNIVHCREGVIMEEFVIGTQTIIAPRMNANGLLVSGDLTVAEGYEYNFGAARANSRHAFTIGTSPAFQFELRMRIATMAGAAPYVFGFRKVAANNAVFNDYTDYATIGMIAGTSATQVVTSTELNAGGNTITNCTDLWGGDGTTNTLTVKVSAAGVVTYLLNGIAPTVVAAFTFDNADVVVPFIRLTHSATPGAVELVSMKIGPQ
jgi:hypothetical protein